jgi:predicted AlkP superfamily pyrophosphatase or phosphodiesterase
MATSAISILVRCPNRAQRRTLLLLALFIVSPAQAQSKTPKGLDPEPKLQLQFSNPTKKPKQQTLRAPLTPPPLTVVIVFDQLRPDTLTRLSSRFLPAHSPSSRSKKGTASNGTALGGFRYLMENSAYYPFSEYKLLQAMTGPGHATLASGSYPATHGIVLNYWWDRDSQAKTYCVEDPNAQEWSYQKRGYSPRFFTGSTLGDELKLASPESKVASIALKERAAILMGGHAADLTLWLVKDQFAWTTSRFYIPEGGSGLPSWIEKRNQDLSTRPEAALAKRDFREFLRQISGVEETFDGALEVVRQLKMGQDSSPDLLWVSLSSHDYLGHAVGPNTQKLDDFTLAEDRALSRFLTLLDQQVPGGLAKVAIALTADHGAPPLPEQAISQRLKAGRYSEKELMKVANQWILEQTGVSEGVVETLDSNLYFGRKLLEKLNNDTEVAALENRLRAYLLATQPMIAEVLLKSDLQAKKLPLGPLKTLVENGTFPSRNGNLIVIPKPYYFLGEEGRGVDHHTHYSYDRKVPLLFAGPGFKRGLRAESSELIDLAPTLAWRLGILPPVLSSGRVLSEAFALE